MTKDVIKRKICCSERGAYYTKAFHSINLQPTTPHQKHCQTSTTDHSPKIKQVTQHSTAKLPFFMIRKSVCHLNFITPAKVTCLLSKRDLLIPTLAPYWMCNYHELNSTTTKSYPTKCGDYHELNTEPLKIMSVSLSRQRLQYYGIQQSMSPNFMQHVWWKYMSS